MKRSGRITDDSIRHRVRYHEPLVAIKETESEWLLGSMHVGKHEAKGGTSWRGDFDESTAFRKQPFDYPDLGRGWAIIFRQTAHSRLEREAIEYVAGWVPSDRGQQADEWIAFLNKEIRHRVEECATRDVSRPEFVPDDRGLDDPGYLRQQLLAKPIDGIVETMEEDEPHWRVGEILLSQEVPTFEIAGLEDFYPDEARFRKQNFDYPSESLRGAALIFHEGRRRGRDVEYLVGWVPSDREPEAERWVAFLNAAMDRARAAYRAQRARYASTGVNVWVAPEYDRPENVRGVELMDEQRRYQLSNPHVWDKEPPFTETIADGRFRIDEHLWGVRRWRVYLGHSIARSTQRVLISIDDGTPKVALDEVRQEISYAIPGILEFAYAGAFDPVSDPVRQKDIKDWGVLVEYLPSGDSARRLITTGLGAIEAARLGGSVGAIVERAARSEMLLVALRPEYIWVEHESTGQLAVRGVTDRYYKFFRSRSYGEFNTLLPFPRSYGAPEAETKATERSLVFMLAVLVAEWTTGRYPFPGLWQSVAGGMLIGIRTSEAPDLAGVPPELEALLLRSMDRDPGARPALTSFVRALEQFART